jgi:hypothetical protein
VHVRFAPSGIHLFDADGDRIVTEAQTA